MNAQTENTQASALDGMAGFNIPRLCAMHGWTDLVFTHISARLPDENGEHRFLINPYGVMFDEMTASALVKIDGAGKICQDSPYFINPAGFTIHSAVHMARADAGCVIHVHTPYGMAVSAQKKGLRRYTQMSMQVYNDRNHGTLTLGPSCGTAFLRMYFLENACKAQIFAQSVGHEDLLIEEPQEMADRVDQQGAAAFIPGMGDNLIWPGLLRKLARTNPGHEH